MLGLNSVDLDELAMALADQADYAHRWLIDPDSGHILVWTADTGIDGHTPVDLDELVLLVVDPLPAHVCYRDRAEFAERISDKHAGRRLARARSATVLHRQHPELVAA